MEYFSKNVHYLLLTDKFSPSSLELVALYLKINFEFYLLLMAIRRFLNKQTHIGW